MIVPLLCFCLCEFNIGGQNVCFMPEGGGNILFGSTREKIYSLVSDKNRLLRGQAGSLLTLTCTLSLRSGVDDVNHRILNESF